MSTCTQKVIYTPLDIIKNRRRHLSEVLKKRPDNDSTLSGLIYRNSSNEEIVVYLDDRHIRSKENQDKYKNSPLDASDVKRISTKILAFLAEPENVINRKLNLSLLAEKIEERKHHISQSLSEYFMTSFNNLLNKRRIEISKKFLLDSSYDNLTLYGIALESGFNSKSTFNRAFLKFTRMTPSVYKTNNSNKTL